MSLRAPASQLLPFHASLRSKLVPALVGCGSLFFASAASAVTLPYLEDFQDGVAQDFFSAGGGPSLTNTFQVRSADGPTSSYVYEHILARDTTVDAAASGFSSIQIPQLGGASTAGTSFMLETTYMVLSASSAYNIGFRFLGQSGSSNDNSYIADISRSGNVRLVEFNGSTASVSSGGSLPSFANNGRSYRLTLSGVYDENNALTLTFTATDVATPTRTASATLRDTTPQTGEFFGLRNNIGATGTGTLNAIYADFAVVPEPASAFFMAVGAAIVGSRRRRISREG